MSAQLAYGPRHLHRKGHPFWVVFFLKFWFTAFLPVRVMDRFASKRFDFNIHAKSDVDQTFNESSSIQFLEVISLDATNY